jgi:integrase
MLTARKRGRTYHLQGRIGGRRVRASLGTRSQDSAHLLTSAIERAIARGRNSENWPELSHKLPPGTFRKLAAIVGYAEKPRPEPPKWSDLVLAFSAYATRLVACGKLRDTTSARYQQTISAFSAFLAESGICRLEEITRSIIESFKAWRLERILMKKQARGGGGLDLDVAILHRIFSYGQENEMLLGNPVKVEGKPGGRPKGGAQPFQAEELARQREAAEDALLIFLLLRHSGLRGGDSVDLRWREIDRKGRGIDRVTQKRGKRVWIPLHPELLFALEAERERRQPRPDETVLVNPKTRKPLTRPRLYERMKALGKRAGVSHVHPHRFRDTFAVDLLLKGASAYDVAKLLGDTVETVEKYYAPYVRELRERARRFVESQEGLENVDTNWTQQQKLELKMQ